MPLERFHRAIERAVANRVRVMKKWNHVIPENIEEAFLAIGDEPDENGDNDDGGYGGGDETKKADKGKDRADPKNGKAASPPERPSPKNNNDATTTTPGRHQSAHAVQHETILLLAKKVNRAPPSPYQVTTPTTSIPNSQSQVERIANSQPNRHISSRHISSRHTSSPQCPPAPPARHATASTSKSTTPGTEGSGL